MLEKTMSILLDNLHMSNIHIDELSDVYIQFIMSLHVYKFVNLP